MEVLGLSDPLTAPTGFGRVARELWGRLPQDLYRLGYVSRGWVGTGRFPGVTCYSADAQDTLCQSALAAAVMDFAPSGPLVLWSLFDPWQAGWLSMPETSPYSTPASRSFLKKHRERIFWMAHFPIDGTGPDAGRPPRWTEDYLGGADMLIAMSRWGQQLLQPRVRQEVRFISHAVDTDLLAPMDQGEARVEIGRAYRAGLAKGLVGMGAEAPRSLNELLAGVDARAFTLQDRFTVLCIMANRSRKHWWDVLRAFRALVDHVPDARLIGVCGDRVGTSDDSWPLEECCLDLGLRLEDRDVDPNVTLIEAYAARPGSPPDYSLRILYGAADVAVLISGGEGFGLPQLEAHACGIPCIVGDYSASTELAVDSRELVSSRGYWTTTAQMVRRPIYRVADITDRLLYAYQNPGWRREVGAAGRAQALARSWDRIMPQWIEAFTQAGQAGKKESAASVV